MIATQFSSGMVIQKMIIKKTRRTVWSRREHPLGSHHRMRPAALLRNLPADGHDMLNTVQSAQMVHGLIGL